MLIWLGVGLMMAMAGQVTTTDQTEPLILDAKDVSNSLPRPPRIVGNPGRFFGAESYPPEARRAGEQGRIVVDLAIDATGKATGCSVYVGESRSLIARTCEIAMTKVQFVPGRDATDKPVAGVTKLSVVWKLEGYTSIAVDAGSVEMLRTVMLVDVSSEGVATGCRMVEPAALQVQGCPQGVIGTKAPFATVGGKPVASRVTVTTVNVVEAVKP